ncbi:hypothetical protein [Actinomadura sp. DC4]|uniref:hypothetical protein n=1 Tax=Actinomadura sp. DC4 TaxID=3055069 RepID=UPI0025B02AEA|nr:hypothetical protein [Actinomadura sp. DC4]MDN3359812.1 hypothetical protein [Actinomadura sp. DC4]
MIVCYANGGGLGHLTRIRAYLHTVAPGRPATILTGSPFAADPRVTGGHPVRSAPGGLGRDGLTRWLAAALAELNPAELVVDAFPAGLSGELTARVIPAGTRIVHLARLLRWDAYRPLLPPEPPVFSETWLVEPVTAGHSAYLRAVSGTAGPLELAEPPSESLAVDGWLIVHSGPEAEIAELVEYARETAALEGVRPRLTLVAPSRPEGLPPGVEHRDVYPAWPLFASAERIITAAGCNVVRQLARWPDRHRMMPFPRRFDDQFTRAARVRDPASTGNDEMEEVP